MCHPRHHEKKYRLADFFAAHWDDYLASPKEPVLPEQLRAVNAMLACRTPRLGTDIYYCPGCKEEHEVYHSCRNRFCPTCGYLDTLKWAGSIMEKMVNKPHHHVVVMLPAAFRPLAKANRKIVYSLLMKSAAAAFIEWFGARWGIKPGIMVVLHTFGDDKKYHVHVHIIITAGGISQETGKYKEIDTKKWFVDYSWFCNKKFRPIFEGHLRRAFKNGSLQHNLGSRQGFEDFLDKENKKKWRMHIEKPLDNAEQIVKYAGRYTRRACLSEYKITSMEGGNISFECKDYKNSKDKKDPVMQVLEFHYRDFFPRLLQHVPEKNFRTVRYYGIYHHMDKNVSKELRKSEKEIKEVKEKEMAELHDYKSPLNCPACNKRMVYLYTLMDRRKRNRRCCRKYTIPDKEAMAIFRRDIKIKNKGNDQQHACLRA